MKFLSISEEKEEKESKGVPGFWLTIFKNVDMLSEMIQPHDEPIFNHLQDVKVIFSEKDPMVSLYVFNLIVLVKNAIIEHLNGTYKNTYVLKWHNMLILI